MMNNKYYQVSIIVIALSVILRIETGSAALVTLSLFQTPPPAPIPARDMDVLPTLEAIMADNYEDCVLPCLWGLKPHDTTIDELIEFIEQHNVDRRWQDPPYSMSLSSHLRHNEPLLFDFEENLYDRAYNLLLSFGFDDDQLTWIKADFAHPHQWLRPELDRISLPQVLAQLSESEIPEIYVPAHLNVRLSTYMVIVVYRENNFQIVYTYDLSSDDPDGPLTRMCLGLERTDYIEFLLGYLDQDVDSYPPDLYGFESLESVFGVSPDEFGQFFIDNPEGCLAVTEAGGDEPTPMPTIQPTLTPGQVAFEELLQTNGGCDLPCWWGFNIGETRAEDWFAFIDSQPFRPFREEPTSTGNIPVDYAYFSFPQSTGLVKIDYTFEDDILQELRITMDNPAQWLSPAASNITLPGLLATLDGTPEIYQFLGGSSSFFSLPVLVMYRDIGFAAEYSLNLFDTMVDPSDASTFQVCLDLEHTTYIDIVIYDPASVGEDSFILPIQRSLDNEESPGYFSIEEFLIEPLTTDEFIEFFVNHPDDCLNPSDYREGEPVQP